LAEKVTEVCVRGAGEVPTEEERGEGGVLKVQFRTKFEVEKKTTWEWRDITFFQELDPNRLFSALISV